MFLCDEGSLLETLDLVFGPVYRRAAHPVYRRAAQQPFLNFDSYFNTAYAAHNVMMSSISSQVRIWKICHW